MAVVIGDRLAEATALRKARQVRKGETLNDDPVPPTAGGGVTPSQERAIESLRRGNPLHRDVLGEVTMRDDGSLVAPVFCSQHGHHFVHITPRGKVTHHGISLDSQPED